MFEITVVLEKKIGSKQTLTERRQRKKSHRVSASLLVGNHEQTLAQNPYRSCTHKKFILHLQLINSNEYLIFNYLLTLGVTVGTL